VRKEGFFFFLKKKEAKKTFICWWLAPWLGAWHPPRSA
jgi:hypothetical protein